jgi:Pyruvate phosphate dikinase, AMP/ATP-binding domain
MSTVLTNPKLRYMASEFDTHFKVFHELMSNKVMDILLVASAYDAYILEEDGSLASRIINEYNGLNLSRPPRITRVDGARQALEAITAQTFDLVITMPHLGDVDSFDFGLSVKQLQAHLPVILLAHSIQGLFPPPAQKDCSGIDQIFIWSGDADLLLAIVKSVEDQRNVDNDTRMAQVRVIILVEDSPLYRSYFLPLMYKEVVHQTQEVLEESLNEEHRLLKMRARPKILVAETFETAMSLYERYQPYLFGVVSDTRFPRQGRMCADAGVQLLSRMKADIHDLPMLLISNEPHNRAKAEQIPAQFLDKNSSHLFEELHAFFLDHLGFGDFVFRTADGSEVARASNLRHLEQVLKTMPDEPLRYHASRNRFSNWIMARSEIMLASQLRSVKVSDFPDTASLRQYLINGIHGLRKWRQKGVVARFDAKGFDSQISDIVKIGRGSLGGKARGMAFVTNLLRQSPQLFEKFQGIDIRIPSTLVITTEGFDAFVAENDLQAAQYVGCSDATIAKAFAEARMPEAIEGDLKAYLQTVHYPLSIRSSSLLEDAHHLPLAGLYKTYMIANRGCDDAFRLAHLIAAVKQVYASTWFEQPRRFALSTAYRHRKERMAVMIQQVAGRAYGDYFYPAVSGIARSQNYYPIDRIQTDDGMAKIALGLGRAMGAGRGGLRFCPKYAGILPDFSKTEDILANAQKTFYALYVGPAAASLDIAADLTLREVADALDEPPLAALVSTYIPQDGRIRDSAKPQGPKVVTFAGLLKHKTFPLADLLNDFLILAREATGCHVEFEFALNLAEGPDLQAVFNVLQMRPMPMGSDPYDVEISPEEKEGALCFASKALGHGKYDHICDIVYIKPQAFDAARTRDMATQVGRINAALKARQRPYLLIGPGRWGSFDPWLGIPVKWEDINAAGAIIELRNASLKAEPSHGSHFFQHITSHGLPYLTVDEEHADYVNWERIQQFGIVQQTPYLCHAHVPAPLLIKCNGRISQCVILAPETEAA